MNSSQASVPSIHFSLEESKVKCWIAMHKKAVGAFRKFVVNEKIIWSTYIEFLGRLASRTIPLHLRLVCSAYSVWNFSTKLKSGGGLKNWTVWPQIVPGTSTVLIYWLSIDPYFFHFIANAHEIRMCVRIMWIWWKKSINGCISVAVLST